MGPAGLGPGRLRRRDLTHTCNRSVESRARTRGASRPARTRAPGRRSLGDQRRSPLRPDGRAPRAAAAAVLDPGVDERDPAPSGDHAGFRTSDSGTPSIVSVRASPDATSRSAISLHPVASSPSTFVTARANAIVRPSGDHAPWPSKPSPSGVRERSRGAPPARSASQSSAPAGSLAREHDLCSVGRERRIEVLGRVAHRVGERPRLAAGRVERPEFSQQIEDDRPPVAREVRGEHRPLAGRDRDRVERSRNRDTAPGRPHLRAPGPPSSRGSQSPPPSVSGSLTRPLVPPSRSVVPVPPALLPPSAGARGRRHSTASRTPGSARSPAPDHRPPRRSPRGVDAKGARKTSS